MSLDWKPEPLGAPTNYSIILDGEFAQQAYDSSQRGYQEKMNELGNNILDSEGIKWCEPYRFKEDSMLITSIYLGSNGQWAATTDNARDELLRYDGHNLDTSKEILVIEKLFDKWHKSTKALLEDRL